MHVFMKRSQDRVPKKPLLGGRRWHCKTMLDRKMLHEIYVLTCIIAIGSFQVYYLDHCRNCDCYLKNCGCESKLHCK